jgi:hypothetical protein
MPHHIMLFCYALDNILFGFGSLAACDAKGQRTQFPSVGQPLNNTQRGTMNWPTSRQLTHTFVNGYRASVPFLRAP